LRKGIVPSMPGHLSIGLGSAAALLFVEHGEGSSAASDNPLL
jgi:hypothetical protein